MNAEQIVQDGVSGIATYTTELLRRLPGRGVGRDRASPHGTRSDQVDAAMRAAGLDGLQPGRAAAAASRAVRRVAHRRRSPTRCGAIAPVDLVHAPSVAVPPVREVPLVVTAHDAAPVTFPETYTTDRGRWFHQRGFAAAARRARGW